MVENPGEGGGGEDLADYSWIIFTRFLVSPAAPSIGGGGLSPRLAALSRVLLVRVMLPQIITGYRRRRPRRAYAQVFPLA